MQPKSTSKQAALGAVSSKPLTRRQHDILEFFENYRREQGISPTLEEIAVALGVNKVTIFGHVAELEKKGVLVRAARGISRGLQLADHEARDSNKLAILGRIAAGRPIEAVEDAEEFDLQDFLPPGRECFALRVQGDSMIDDGIRDGDVVVVERRSEAKNGETVVAVLEDEECTLKRFYREKGRIRLQPSNSALQPIFVTSVEVRGVVVGVLRRY
ncbi:MAG: transcriptional repressor LexA [Planctomycetes bacterium]|nr:transcriptional repressor LexA [Planctomycetota bacterium]